MSTRFEVTLATSFSGSLSWGRDGSPLNLAGLVNHMYYTKNSAFAFHALLKEQYLHQLCAGINTDRTHTLDTLMLIMAHLFGRRNCRSADKERAEMIKRSASIVFLPSMPKRAAAILRKHNQDTLDVFRTYVGTFVSQHIHEDDETLPLTKVKCGGNSIIGTSVPGSMPPTRIRSPFVALSGLDDIFTSVSDLCATVRSGVFLEESAIPHVGLYPDEEGAPPLNAWLLDFFKHGSVVALEKANGIRRGDIWFMLKDFSLVLATIITSLSGFVGLREVTDMDMLDVWDARDAQDALDDDLLAARQGGESATIPGSNSMAAGPSLPLRGKTARPSTKATVSDNWDDDLAEDGADCKDTDHATGRPSGSADIGLDDRTWAELDGSQGLRQVLKAFILLRTEFDAKFRKMWA